MKRLMNSAWALLLACVLGLALTACVEAEEGETWDEWEFRNAINCGKYTAWSIYKIKDGDKWLEDYENNILQFSVQFFSKDHNFHSSKAHWMQDAEGSWIADESTREEFLPADETAFTLDTKHLVIEGTVGGEKYFRINLNKKVADGFMEGKLHFYKENKTYEVIMIR